MVPTAQHDPRAVANELLRIAAARGLSLTPMQLIKLVFFAHGWCLGLLNRGLFRQPFSAWQYGPVLPEVYWAFQRFGRQAITKPSTDEFGVEYRSNFDASEQRIMEQVVEALGRKHAFTLSDITHRHGSPWHQAYQTGARNEISHLSIRDYYASQAATT